MHFVKYILVSIICMASTSMATASVLIGDKDWSQPNLFTSYSYNDFTTICDVNSGLCDGQLSGGEDLTGLIWATVEDVNALFNSLLGSEELGPGPSSFNESRSIWAQNVLTLFNATQGGAQPQLSGSTRTSSGSTNHYFAGVHDRPSNGMDTIYTNRSRRTTLQNAGIGGWFYRALVVPDPPPSTIPAPGSSLLISMGMACLLYRHRSRPSISSGGTSGNRGRRLPLSGF